jgi:hypothetical protein
MGQSNKSGPRVLDIGCGTNKIPGAIGMDVNPRAAAALLFTLRRVFASAKRASLCRIFGSYSDSNS